MLSGVTESGFAFTLDEAALDDYELLEALAGIDRGEMWSIIDVVNRLLGKEQGKALKDHVRTETGRVSTKALIGEITSILKAKKETKNS